MPYIGNQAVVGDSANTFKTLDGIASFTYTGRATSSGFNHESYSNNKIFQCIMSHLSSYLQGAKWDAEM